MKVEFPGSFNFIFIRVCFNFWLVALGALYQLGYLPATRGGGMAPLPPSRSAYARGANIKLPGSLIIVFRCNISICAELVFIENKEVMYPSLKNLYGSQGKIQYLVLGGQGLTFISSFIFKQCRYQVVMNSTHLVILHD